MDVADAAANPLVDPPDPLAHPPAQVTEVMDPVTTETETEESAEATTETALKSAEVASAPPDAPHAPPSPLPRAVITELEPSRMLVELGKRFAESLVDFVIEPFKVEACPKFLSLGNHAYELGVFAQGLISSLLGRVVEISFNKPEAPAKARGTEKAFQQLLEDKGLSRVYNSWVSNRERPPWVGVVVGELNRNTRTGRIMELSVVSIVDFRKFWDKNKKLAGLNENPRAICAEFSAKSSRQPFRILLCNKLSLLTSTDAQFKADYHALAACISMTFQGLYTPVDHVALDQVRQQLEPALPPPPPPPPPQPRPPRQKLKARLLTGTAFIEELPGGAPAEGEQGQAPAEGEQGQAPAEGEQGQAPAEGEQGQAPAKAQPPPPAPRRPKNPQSMLAKIQARNKSRKKSVVVKLSSVTPRRGDLSAPLICFGMMGENIARPDYKYTFPPDNPAGFVRYLRWYLKMAQDQQRTRKKESFHGRVLRTIIPMRIEELTQDPTKQWADLTPVVRDLLTEQNMREELDLTGLRKVLRESGLLTVLERLGIVFGPVMTMAPVGKAFDDLTAKLTVPMKMYCADLDAFMEQYDAQNLQPPPADLVERVSAAFAEGPVKVDSPDYETADLFFMINLTGNTMLNMMSYHKMEPEKIIMLMDYWLSLKVKLEPPYNMFVTLDIVLALFNKDNNGHFLENAAVEFAERGATGGLLRPLNHVDFWVISSPTMMLHVMPDVDLQPIKRGAASKASKSRAISTRRLLADLAPPDGAAAPSATPDVESFVEGENGRKQVIRNRTQTERMKATLEPSLPQMSNKKRAEKRKAEAANQNAGDAAQEENDERGRFGVWSVKDMPSLQTEVLAKKSAKKTKAATEKREVVSLSGRRVRPTSKFRGT